MLASVPESYMLWQLERHSMSMRWQRLHPGTCDGSHDSLIFVDTRPIQLHALHDVRNVTRNTASGSDDLALRQRLHQSDVTEIFVCVTLQLRWLGIVCRLR